MHTEQKYDFRKKLLTVHEANIRDFKKICGADKYVIDDYVTIGYYESAGEVAVTSAEDFADFLRSSMCLQNVVVTKDTDKSSIRIHTPEEATSEILGEADRYRGFKITIQDYVDIYAHDERGISQALYYLEDIMTFEKGGCLTKKVRQS